MKFGIADYGMNVWDGGCFDIEERLIGLKKIGYDGTERLTAASASDALERAARYRRLGADFATCLGPDPGHGAPGGGGREPGGYCTAPRETVGGRAPEGLVGAQA